MASNFREKSSFKRLSDVLGTMNLLPTDIIILIMGPTGSGKSTLVNLLAGRQAVTVGHQLESCTKTVHPIVIETTGWTNPMTDRTPRRLVLVDTPGFDNVFAQDDTIYRQISNWLKAKCKNSIVLAGAIFLQEISHARMRGTTMTHTELFRRLCAENPTACVALCTTMWEEVPPKLAIARETKLRESYWKDMISDGAQVMRIYRERNSAWEVVNAILTRYKPTAMSIQKDLVKPQNRIRNKTADSSRSLNTVRKSTTSTYSPARMMMHGVPRLNRNNIPSSIENRLISGMYRELHTSFGQVNTSELSQIEEEQEQEQMEHKDEEQEEDSYESQESRSELLDDSESSIVTGTSLVNFNPVSAKRAQLSVVSSTSSSSSATTEYGSIYLRREL